MSRLDAAFRDARSANRAALICYITAGDGGLRTTVEAACALEDAGADVIELGIPFSDPIADGPTIQSSCQRSIAAGTTPGGVLEAVSLIRKRSSIPLVLMTYHNPVLRYGHARFAADAAGAGVDGTIQTDLPPEEGESWLAESRRCGLDTIFLAAPTTTEARLERVLDVTTGFLYYVSRLGVTGSRTDLPAELAEGVHRVRARSVVPVGVGFGISTADHVRRIAMIADGAVVGSALVKLFAEAVSPADAVRCAVTLTSSLAAATHRV